MEELFRAWLEWIAEEEEPDLWAEVDRARDEISSARESVTDGDALLSADERKAVSEHVSWMREQVLRQQDLNGEQVRILDSRLAELESAAERLTRKDYLNYAIGAIVTLAVELALDADVRNALLRATISVVSNAFGGFNELSPPPIG